MAEANVIYDGVEDEQLSVISVQEQSDWYAYETVLASKLELLEQHAIRRTDYIQLDDAHDFGCMIPRKFSGKAAESYYNIDKNKDGYWRLRFLKTNEWILNKDGTVRFREYNRKDRNGNTKPATRREHPKGSMFLTHLVLFADGVDLPSERYKSFVQQDGTVLRSWQTISHLCGRRECFNRAHLVLEPHVLNLSRNQCCHEICIHEPVCVRTADAIQAKVALLQERYETPIPASGTTN